MEKKITLKEWANRTARSLMAIAESVDKLGGTGPETNHRIADRIRAEAALLIEHAKAGK
jgi:hypothetical protein